MVDPQFAKPAIAPATMVAKRDIGTLPSSIPASGPASHDFAEWYVPKYTALRRKGKKGRREGDKSKKENGHF